jgi:quercetin dioxygenase-like cupin family protein
MKKALVAALVLFAVPALAGAPTVTPVISTDKTVIGQPIEVPQHPTVVTTIVTFQPGDKTAVHKHPFPHFGYMLEGTLTLVNTATGKSFDVKPGEFLVEMMNTYHYGENRGTVPARILIIDELPAGVTTNSIAKE